MHEGSNIMENIIVYNAKVMSKGQIILPKEIRTKLGVDTGDRVIFVCENDQIILMNDAVYDMKIVHSLERLKETKQTENSELPKSQKAYQNIQKFRKQGEVDRDYKLELYAGLEEKYKKI